MPITWFFEGVAENGGAAPGIDDDMRTLFTTRSGNDLAKAFLAIEDTDSRQILIDVARALCRTPVKNAAGRGRPNALPHEVDPRRQFGIVPTDLARNVGDKGDRLAEAGHRGLALRRHDRRKLGRARPQAQDRMALRPSAAGRGAWDSSSGEPALGVAACHEHAHVVAAHLLQAREGAPVEGGRNGEHLLVTDCARQAEGGDAKIKLHEP